MYQNRLLYCFFKFFNSGNQRDNGIFSLRWREKREWEKILFDSSDPILGFKREKALGPKEEEREKERRRIIFGPTVIVVSVTSKTNGPGASPVAHVSRLERQKK